MQFSNYISQLMDLYVTYNSANYWYVTNIKLSFVTSQVQKDSSKYDGYTLLHPDLCVGYTLVSKMVDDLPKVGNNMTHKGHSPKGIILLSTKGKSCTVLETKL